MSDAPSYHNPKDVPGKFTVVETDHKDEKGRTKIKIRIRERIKTRTRVRKKNNRSLKIIFSNIKKKMDQNTIYKRIKKIYRLNKETRKHKTS